MRFMMFLVLLMVCCSAGAARAEEVNDTTTSSIKIDRFAKIDDGVYRSARPDDADLTALKNELGIRTVIDLEDDLGAILNELVVGRTLGLEIDVFPMNGFIPVSDSAVNRILQIMTDKSKQPVLIHCKVGRDRTGMVAGLYRVFVDNWTPEAAYREMLEMGYHPYFLALDYYFHKKVLTKSAP